MPVCLADDDEPEILLCYTFDYARLPAGVVIIQPTPLRAEPQMMKVLGDPPSRPLGPGGISDYDERTTVGVVIVWVHEVHFGARSSIATYLPNPRNSGALRQRHPNCVNWSALGGRHYGTGGKYDCDSLARAQQRIDMA
jgi:hypothetical protein